VNDIGTAETLIVDALKSSDKVLKQPEPVSGVKSLEEYSVVLLARCWVERDYQYRAPYDLKKLVKDKLHAGGILIPVNRQAVAERPEGPAGKEMLPPSVIAASPQPKSEAP
jgi:small-conductance mechanosensitive channel